MSVNETHYLIRRLSRDPLPPSGPSLEARLRSAALGGAASVVVAVVALIGVRADMMSVLFTVPIALKFLGALALALAAFRIATQLARPGSNPLCRLSVAVLGVTAAMCLAALISVVVGGSGLPSFIVFQTCSGSIALLGLMPLALALFALRAGAATCPGRAGAAAGVLAGAIAAFAYAIACPLNDPQMIVVAHMAGISGPVLAGAAAGRVLLAW